MASNHLHQLRQRVAEKTIICSVDGGFTNQTVFRNPPENTVLICTDPNLSLDKILQSYLWRWKIELNFRDEKAVFGVGLAQVRNAEAVETAPALGVAAYAYLLLAGTAVENGYLPLPK